MCEVVECGTERTKNIPEFSLKSLNDTPIKCHDITTQTLVDKELRNQSHNGRNWNENKTPKKNRQSLKESVIRIPKNCKLENCVRLHKGKTQKLQKL